MASLMDLEILGFAAAGNCAGLVAKRPLGGGANEPPRAVPRRFLHLDLVARGRHINLVREQFDGPFPIGRRPAHCLLLQIESNIARHINNFRKPSIQGMTFRLQFHGLAAKRNGFLKRMSAMTDMLVRVKLLAQIVSLDKPGRLRHVFLPRKARTDLPRN